MDVPTEMIATAVRLHQDGDLAQAEALYRRILEQRPDHPGALHLLGVLAHQQGHDDRAVDLIARAIALRPDQATYHSNHGVALLGLGRLGGRRRPESRPAESLCRPATESEAFRTAP
jgi:Flp pilus assembly protein TadD